MEIEHKCKQRLNAWQDNSTYIKGEDVKQTWRETTLTFSILATEGPWWRSWTNNATNVRTNVTNIFHPSNWRFVMKILNEQCNKCTNQRHSCVQAGRLKIFWTCLFWFSCTRELWPFCETNIFRPAAVYMYWCIIILIS